MAEIANLLVLIIHTMTPKYVEAGGQLVPLESAREGPVTCLALCMVSPTFRLLLNQSILYSLTPRCTV